jgi:hypothetical protein
MSVLIIVAILSAFIVVALLMALTSRLFRVALRGPLCGNCGYNLTGSQANRCPECGELFIDAGVVRARAPTGSRRRYVVWLGAATAITALLLVAIEVAIFAARAAQEAERAARLQAEAAQLARFQAQSLAATSQAAICGGTSAGYAAASDATVATSQATDK